MMPDLRPTVPQGFTYLCSTGLDNGTGSVLEHARVVSNIRHGKPTYGGL
jgi:hypothetical protein